MRKPDFIIGEIVLQHSLDGRRIVVEAFVAVRVFAKIEQPVFVEVFVEIDMLANVEAGLKIQVDDLRGLATRMSFPLPPCSESIPAYWWPAGRTN